VRPCRGFRRSTAGGSCWRFLLAAGGGAAALAFGLQRPAFADSPITPKLPDYPFTLGVASGDPTPDAVVLWTKLAPQPLAPAGGMPTTRPVAVNWEVATDETFRTIVRDGVAQAHPEYSYSVHMDVHGLEPARDYWYRFSVGDHRTEPARTRTAPAPGTMPSQMRFAFASCMNYRAGYVVAELTPDVLTMTYRAVNRVSDPQDPVYSLQRFAVESGTPRVHLA
jgi:alkaline phosphatase D